MPNSIFVLFRGTYSAKSAGSYNKPSSIVPFNVAKQYTKAEIREFIKRKSSTNVWCINGD